MTTPTDNPDEILARVIEQKQEEIAGLKIYVARNFDESFKYDLRESEVELAMLESHRSALNYIGSIECTCPVAGEGNVQHCQRCDVLIQNYDAIRGIVG